MPYRYCPVGVLGMALGIVVDLSALSYLLHPFPSPHRAGVPSWLVPVSSDYASRRRAISRGSVYPRLEMRVGVGSGVWPSLPVGEVGQSWKRALFLFGQAFRLERWARVKSECCSSLARPFSQRLDRPSGLSSGFWADPGVAHC
jgi:hypothetical protein